MAAWLRVLCSGVSWKVSLFRTIQLYMFHYFTLKRLGSEWNNYIFYIKPLHRKLNWHSIQSLYWLWCDNVTLIINIQLYTDGAWRKLNNYVYIIYYTLIPMLYVIHWIPIVLKPARGTKTNNWKLVSKTYVHVNFSAIHIHIFKGFKLPTFRMLIVIFFPYTIITSFYYQNKKIIF